MKRLFLLLPLALFFTALNSNAHSGHKHQPNKTSSSFTGSLSKKYSINSYGSHLGHFYIKKSKVKKNYERLRIEQTFHFDEDITQKLNAKFFSENDLLQYSVSLPSINTKYFIFVDLKHLDGSENTGYRITHDTVNGTLSQESIVLIVEDEAETDDDSSTEDHGDEHGHSHGTSHNHS